ncbi:MAG: hypothetical protein PHS10_06805 [Thiovulaceae bacterium]|nr:hypothetical protein [Sulfurimonadaceae bacterium]
MKKFNLFKEIIIVDKPALLHAVNASKEFAIDIFGNVHYEPFPKKTPFIFQGKHAPQAAISLSPSSAPSLGNVLGKNYQVLEDEDRVLIKAFSNWQEIIKRNLQEASYDDTTADGVSEFSSKDLEDIGWHATEFNIDYRTLVEELEEKCEGILLCIEQDDPYQFSGLGFLSDDTHAKEVLFDFCRSKIEEMMQNDASYAPQNLTEDEKEAAQFFGLLH